MRLEIDGNAWNQGFWDGADGKPLRSCPYTVGTTECWSWSSGYIEGNAARNGFKATLPCARRCSLEKTRPPLRLELFRYAPHLQPQRRKKTTKKGSTLHADRGSKFAAD